jgi:hypothetical protein
MVNLVTIEAFHYRSYLIAEVIHSQSFLLIALTQCR